MRPLGERLDWKAATPPVRTALSGSHVLLRPVDASTDAEPLYAISHPPDGDPAIWDYLPDGPYESLEHLRQTLAWAGAAEDRVYFTLVRLRDARPLGMASYLRIEPQFGTIEIGHIWFGGQLQRTTAATEAIYLLAHHAFDDLGFRRLEWKCNALNAASRRAAERFGFAFEGVFRKHQVIKGRNRDTAWYAITDEQWPVIRAGFQAWLQDANFDGEGRQIRTLGELIARADTDAGMSIRGADAGVSICDNADLTIPAHAGLSIRDGAARDVEPVLSLWTAAGSQPTVTDTHEGVRRMLATDRRALLIAESEGAAVGTLIAVWDGWRGSFYRLAVDPQRRRQGIATALLREGERRLRARGAVRLTAIVAEDDPTAIGFWEAAGYTRQDNRARFVHHLG